MQLIHSRSLSPQGLPLHRRHLFSISTNTARASGPPPYGSPRCSPTQRIFQRPLHRRKAYQNALEAIRGKIRHETTLFNHKHEIDAKITCQLWRRCALTPRPAPSSIIRVAGPHATSRLCQGWRAAPPDHA